MKTLYTCHNIIYKVSDAKYCCLFAFGVFVAQHLLCCTEWSQVVIRVRQIHHRDREMNERRIASQIRFVFQSSSGHIPY